MHQRAHQRARRGQVSMPFYWIYILIAGTTILLFFIGIVTRQRGVADQQLSLSVTQKLDGIFTGAALSEQTVNVIDVPELSFFFTCDDEGVSEYRVGERGSPRSMALQPFFAPAALRTSQLITWTMGFSMPYTIINLLLVGSPTVTTFLVYQDSDPPSIQLRNAILESLPEQFSVQALSVAELSRITGIKPPLKLVFLTRINQAQFGDELPVFVRALPDGLVSVQRVELTGCSVTYYRKSGNQLIAEGTASVLNCIEEKNPAFYAALFSDSAEAYNCGMRKAFHRMSLLADISMQRASLLKEAYTAEDVCWFQVNPAVFQQLKEHSAVCAGAVEPGCLAGIRGAAAEVRQQNAVLQDNNCAVLY